MSGQSSGTSTETATLASGCFWCTEAVFNQIRGIIKVESGYSGGKTANPSYEQVCTGMTGHAETVQVTYDPKQISYKEVLEVFFTTHDPTTPNRQGADVGTQYRSAVFYHNYEQEATARKVIADFNNAKIWKRPIVSEVVPFEVFYKAEDYHQNYFEKNPNAPYCQVVIEPKIAKLRQHYWEKLKKA